MPRFIFAVQRFRLYLYTGVSLRDRHRPSVSALARQSSGSDIPYALKQYFSTRITAFTHLHINMRVVKARNARQSLGERMTSFLPLFGGPVRPPMLHIIVHPRNLPKRAYCEIKMCSSLWFSVLNTKFVKKKARYIGIHRYACS